MLLGCYWICCWWWGRCIPLRWHDYLKSLHINRCSLYFQPRHTDCRTIGEGKVQLIALMNFINKFILFNLQLELLSTRDDDVGVDINVSVSIKLNQSIKEMYKIIKPVYFFLLLGSYSSSRVQIKFEIRWHRSFASRWRYSIYKFNAASMFAHSARGHRSNAGTIHHWMGSNWCRPYVYPHKNQQSGATLTGHFNPIVSGTESQSDALLKTNVTAVSITSCNQTLLDYNKDSNSRALRDGLRQTQLCAFDPQARNGNSVKTNFPIYSRNYLIFGLFFALSSQMRARAIPVDPSKY